MSQGRSSICLQHQVKGLDLSLENEMTEIVLQEAQSGNNVQGERCEMRVKFGEATMLVQA